MAPSLAFVLLICYHVSPGAAHDALAVLQYGTDPTKLKFYQDDPKLGPYQEIPDGVENFVRPLDGAEHFQQKCLETLYNIGNGKYYLENQMPRKTLDGEWVTDPRQANGCHACYGTFPDSCIEKCKACWLGTDGNMNDKTFPLWAILNPKCGFGKDETRGKSAREQIANLECYQDQNSVPLWSQRLKKIIKRNAEGVSQGFLKKIETTHTDTFKKILADLSPWANLNTWDFVRVTEAIEVKPPIPVGAIGRFEGHDEGKYEDGRLRFYGHRDGKSWPYKKSATGKLEYFRPQLEMEFVDGSKQTEKLKSISDKGGLTFYPNKGMTGKQFVEAFESDLRARTTWQPVSDTVENLP